MWLDQCKIAFPPAEMFCLLPCTLFISNDTDNILGRFCLCPNFIYFVDCYEPVTLFRKYQEKSVPIIYFLGNSICIDTPYISADWLKGKFTSEQYSNMPRKQKTLIHTWPRQSFMCKEVLEI